MNDPYAAELAAPALPILRVSHDPAAVRRLQTWLVVRGYCIWVNPANAPGIDGDYGPGTQAGVEAFARSNGIAPLVDDRFWFRLTSPMLAASSYVPTAKTLGDAIVQVAEVHVQQQAREARMVVDGRLAGADNSGPWPAVYNRNANRDPWCQGFVLAMIDQASRALGVAPVFSPAIGGRAWNLWVPDMVTEARRLGRFVSGHDTARRVGPGSLFFAQGYVQGDGGRVWSHVHIGIVSADMGDTVYTIEGNTNDNGSSNGWLALKCKRSRAGLDFGAL